MSLIIFSRRQEKRPNTDKLFIRASPSGSKFTPVNVILFFVTGIILRYTLAFRVVYYLRVTKEKDVNISTKHCQINYENYDNGWWRPLQYNTGPTQAIYLQDTLRFK